MGGSNRYGALQYWGRAISAHPLFSGPLAGPAHKLVSSNILFYFMHQFRNGNAFYFRCWQLGPVMVTEGESYRVLSQEQGTARHPGILHQPSEKTGPVQVKNSRVKIPIIKKCFGVDGIIIQRRPGPFLDGFCTHLEQSTYATFSNNVQPSSELTASCQTCLHHVED